MNGGRPIAYRRISDGTWFILNESRKTYSRKSPVVPAHELEYKESVLLMARGRDGTLLFEPIYSLEDLK